MGVLADARPWEVGSLGLRLLRASSAVGEAQSAALSAPGLRWRGRAAEAFEVRLGRVVRSLPEVEDAYDAAARVLLRYAVELEESSLLAQRASALRVEADRLSAASTLSGPDPGDALRMDAARCEAQAEAQHEAAARRAVAELRELTAAAPAVRGGASRERFWADLRSSLSGQASGAAALFVTSAEALAGNRAARDELVTVAKQSVRVWEPFVELWHQLDDDRAGLALGSTGGMFLSRGIRPVRPPSGRTRNAVGPLGLARQEAEQEAALRNLLDRLGVIARPYQRGDTRIAIYAHEAMDAHVIRQHTAKSDAFQRWRADTHPSGASSAFPDARRAQLAMDAVVAAHRAKIDALLSREVGKRLRVEVDMGQDVIIGRGFVRDDPQPRKTSKVYAVFQNTPTGVVLVSLYPKVR